MIRTSADKVEKIQFAAEVLKTIGHPSRLQIIELLMHEEECSVAQIQENLGLEQSLLSHHLNRMKLRGILSSHKIGKQVFYAVKLQQVKKILECMDNCDFQLKQ